MNDDGILWHFSPLNRPFITLEDAIDLAAKARYNFQVYWHSGDIALVQDFREDTLIPAQPIKWETIGQLIDLGVLIYNHKHSWELIKRWYVSDEWLKKGGPSSS